MMLTVLTLVWCGSWQDDGVKLFDFGYIYINFLNAVPDVFNLKTHTHTPRKQANGKRIHVPNMKTNSWATTAGHQEPHRPDRRTHPWRRRCPWRSPPRRHPDRMSARDQRSSGVRGAAPAVAAGRTWRATVLHLFFVRLRCQQRQQRLRIIVLSPQLENHCVAQGWVNFWTLWWTTMDCQIWLGGAEQEQMGSVV